MPPADVVPAFTAARTEDVSLIEGQSSSYLRHRLWSHRLFAALVSAGTRGLGAAWFFENAVGRPAAFYCGAGIAPRRLFFHTAAAS